MVVHVRPDGHHPHRGARGPQPRRALRHHAAATTTCRSTATSTSAGCRTCCPGMEAAFIDIGTPKNGVLYRGDVVVRPRRRRGGAAAHRAPAAERPDDPRAGHEEPDRGQGRAPHPGGEPGRPVRRDGAEPARRRTASRSACPTTSASGCARCSTGSARPTPASSCAPRPKGATAEELERDVDPAAPAVGADLGTRRARSKPARLLYKEPPLAIRLIREEFTKEYRGVAIDDPALYEEVKAYVDAIAPELADRVELYEPEAEDLPLFERFHVHEQLHKALDRKVWLPSGGSLVIERTEALTVIDVNTGQERRQVEPRGDGLPQQPRGRRGGRPPAPAAGHRRDHRHRLHRHGDQEEPRRGDAGVPGGPGPRQDPDPGLRHLRAGPASR